MSSCGDAPKRDGDNAVCFSGKLWLGFDGIPAANSAPDRDWAKTQPEDWHQTEDRDVVAHQSLLVFGRNKGFKDIRCVINTNRRTTLVALCTRCFLLHPTWCMALRNAAIVIFWTVHACFASILSACWQAKQVIGSSSIGILTTLSACHSLSHCVVSHNHFPTRLTVS